MRTAQTPPQMGRMERKRARAMVVLACAGIGDRNWRVVQIHAFAVGARAGEGTVLLCGGVHVRHRCRIADEEGRIAEASGAPATASSLLESGNIKKLLSVRWVTRSPITSPPSCLLLLRVCCVCVCACVRVCVGCIHAGSGPT